MNQRNWIEFIFSRRSIPIEQSQLRKHIPYWGELQTYITFEINEEILNVL